MRLPRKKPDDHLTGVQLRAALGILNMSVLDLSQRTGLAANTIKRALKTNAPAPINISSAKLIVGTLEAAGVTLLAAEGGLGGGARLTSASVETAPLTRRRRAETVPTSQDET